MKKLSLILITIIAFHQAHAQISDADAKLKYQQIEETYNAGKYAETYDRTMALMAEMKSQPPRLVYMLIKAAYKCLQTGDGLKQTYDNFNSFAELSGKFLSSVDRASYPTEKYAEVQMMQKYFKDKTVEYAAQKDRTPQDAVDFLNECAKKFPNAKVFALAREQEQWAQSTSADVTSFIRTIRTGSGTELTSNANKHVDSLVFRLDKNALIVNTVVREVGSKEKYNKIYMGQDKVFLSRVDKITTVEGLDGASMPVSRNVLRGTNDHLVNIKNAPSNEFRRALYFTKTFEYKGWEDPANNYQNSWRVSKTGFDIYYYFDTKSQEFIDGKYESRILEAFQFLIDSFPKEKPAEAEQKKSKF